MIDIEVPPNAQTFVAPLTFSSISPGTFEAHLRGYTFRGRLVSDILARLDREKKAHLDNSGSSTVSLDLYCSEPELSLSCVSYFSTKESKTRKDLTRFPVLDLPVEIVEQIAIAIRDPKGSMLSAGAAYTLERRSGFSTARFTLSALSKVHSLFRRIVEPILYRDIQLDFTGWKGRKNPQWPAGSLFLLLRTLESRPELGSCIHVAALDYQLSRNAEVFNQSLEQFLALTPNLKTLFLPQCPVALWDLPTLSTSTIATTYSSGLLPAILDQFPKLENLHLRDCHNFKQAAPPHNLQRLSLTCSPTSADVYFAQVLAVCAETVHTVDVQFLGGLRFKSPRFDKYSSMMLARGGRNLRTLRLDNISVLSHVESVFGQLLQGLPALRELYLSNHRSFEPTAFSLLPPSLRTLTISDYYGAWDSQTLDDDTFLMALGACIAATDRPIYRVLASEGYHSGLTQSVDPVSVACQNGGIPFILLEERHAFVELDFAVA